MIGPRIPKLTARQERDAYNAATARDKGRCVRCGSPAPTERDHRQNRTAYNTTVANLQLLGGPFGCACHKWKSENPAEAVRDGFACPSWARPELWPAYRFDAGWVIYDDDGGWQTINESTAEFLMIGGGRT